MAAASEADFETVSRLFHAGVDVSSTAKCPGHGKAGYPALNHAIRSGHENYVSLLLDAGARIDISATNEIALN